MPTPAVEGRARRPTSAAVEAVTPRPTSAVVVAVTRPPTSLVAAVPRRTLGVVATRKAAVDVRHRAMATTAIGLKAAASG
jgi:hypothetical protein